MTEPFTLYKLILLYMLHYANFPMTNSQLSAFILEAEYTTYMKLQQAITDLLETELIYSSVIQGTPYYSITPEGENTIQFFKNKISPEIQEDIEQFLQENRFELRKQGSVTTEYFKTTDGEYAAHCMVRERDTTLIELTLSAPSKEIADRICSNFKQQNSEIYAYLIEKLSTLP